MNVATPLLLIVYAAATATWAPRLMRRATWIGRSPVASILLWQTITMSTLASVVLAGAAVALPTLPWTTDVAQLLRACADALNAHYATPGGNLASLAGVALATTVSVRTTWSVARQLWTTHRHGIRQRDAAHLVAKAKEATGFLVVDSEESVVYCVPGRDRTVVFTSTALSKLDAPQVAAVLAHEEAHLRARHQLVLSLGRGIHRAFPFVALFRTASAELARLVEMHADDVAARHHDRRTLAMALIQLAEVRSPTGTLGAAGSSTALRVSRLAKPPEVMTQVGSIVTSMMVLTMIVLPVTLAASPALSLLAVHYCPVDWTS